MYYSIRRVRPDLARLLCRRTGDMSLYEYETSEGLWTTEGGPKSIKTAVTNYMYELDYTVEHFCDDEDCLQGADLLTPANRIDSVADRGDQAGKQWVFEVWFAPIGNKVWQDQGIKDRYLRLTPNSEEYGTSIGTSGPSGHPWGGSGVILPGNLFMFGQMEDRVDPYP